MIDLTNQEAIKKLDPKDVFGSTEMLLSQCEQIWEEGKRLSYPYSVNDIKNIVFCGMGGSAMGAHVAYFLYQKELAVPFYVLNNYHLPAFVGESSLVILSSYSGSTEEVLSCAEQAKEKGAKITGLTTGGKLDEFFQSNKYPSLIFSAQYNPSGQPRLGTGYSVFGTLAILKAIRLISLSDEEVKRAIQAVRENQENIKKIALQQAKVLFGTIPVVFAAEFLSGNAHIMRNQFNETAKSFSAFEDLPELNHHLMEGLKNPPDKKLTVLFITSNLYSDILKKRVELTKDVVSKNSIPWIEYQAQGNDTLTQVLSVLSFGGYLTLYLALLYGQDPSLIPWVDYFKEKLK